MSDPTTVEAIFSAALERPSAEARAAYLDQACAGDDGLRRRVEWLLRAHLRAAGFLERPVETIGDPAAPLARSRPLDFLAAPSRPDSLGRLGPFEVLEVVGEGGTGLVLRAFDAKLHRVVAIKVMAGSLSAVGPARRRFVREARAAASVIHENVVAIHSVDDDGPVPYLVMAFVDGPTLQQRIDREGPLPLAEVLRIGKQIASGLAAAHAQGLVHRDVKPANILLENGVERVKITDFGLARAVDDPGLTHQGQVAGTPAYMAPEQASGGRVDARGDLFSLGSVLYAMCTGQPPFRGESVLAVLRRVCDETPRPVRRLNPEVPSWLEGLIARLHARDAAKRSGSAAEIAELLERRLAELRDGRAEDRPGAPTRRRWRILLAALLLAAVGLGSGEATGVTDVRGTVVRLLFPDGTLVVEVDDPGVRVAVEGTDLVVSGAGVRELRLRPGAYRVAASKNGRVVRRELVQVVKDGRQIVRISDEPTATHPGEVSRTGAAEWERKVAGLPPEEQAREVAARLRQLNPGFESPFRHEIVGDHVELVEMLTNDVTDLTPLRALRGLKTLWCGGTPYRRGRLADLRPLQGLPLEWLNVAHTQVADLEAIRGMPLKQLIVSYTRVTDLEALRGLRLENLSAEHLASLEDVEPLRGMPLKELNLCNAGPIADIGPLEGMPLEALNLTACRLVNVSVLASLSTLRVLCLDETAVSDLSPIRNLPLTSLSLIRTPVADFGPLRGKAIKEIRLDYRPELEPLVQSLRGLTRINEVPAQEFWKTRHMK